jgi:Putative Ig domain
VVGRTVDVGATLDMMVGASAAATTGGRLIAADDPPTTYTISPEPLPANASFNLATGQFSFVPSPSQVGQYDFTITATTNGQTTVTDLQIEVAAPLCPSTEVSGQVVDISGNPLSGVPVMIGNVQATTDASGNFMLSNVPSNPGPLTVDGYHADATGDYLMLMAPTSQFLGHPAYADSNNVVPRPIVLPHIDLANATDFGQLNPGQPHDLTSPRLPGVVLHVPANAAMTMDGKPYTGKIALTALPAAQLQEVFPAGVRVSSR